MKKVLAVLVAVAFLGGVTMAQNPPKTKEKPKTEVKTVAKSDTTKTHKAKPATKPAVKAPEKTVKTK
jgi:hypothetical protein